VSLLSFRSLNHNLHLLPTLQVSCLFLATPAAAVGGFKPVNPDELKMISQPKAPGAPAIILFREVDRNDNLPMAANCWPYRSSPRR
jgi:hypothetical protein